ncbi:MAG: Thioredoxin reductase [Labilithrix sp.]|nr:Thioredoxin reductase [Labilithrix sp.]
MSPPIRPRTTRRAAPSSDVTRVRVLGLAALGAGLGAAAVLALGGVPAGSPRVMARPHATHALACASCHAAPAGTEAATYMRAGACRSCHAGADHVSTRPAHRRLAAQGELTCATCHPAHEGAQGVTFGPAGSFVRWGAGAEQPGTLRDTAPGVVKPGATVPFVAVAACARCHDPSSPRDPVAACVPSAARPRVGQQPSLCFDEHSSVTGAEGRLVTWDAAREVATTTAWVAPPPRHGTPVAPLGGAFAGAALVTTAVLLDRRRRRATPAPPPARPPERKRLPVVNASTCLGCYACVDVCPFDVLTIERYVAVVARPDECCGVVLCEQVCPNGSLTVGEGELATDQPRVTEHLESVDVPGLYLAGDLTGLPLIKNAINQGVRAVDHIARTGSRAGAGEVDVLVIGAGPAGLSAALRAKEKKLSCVVLEQATVAASVKSFPRDKIIYDPPLELPTEGELWMKEATKEELVAQWTRIVRSRALDVREQRRVTDIARDPSGSFVVTAGAERHRAARVVVAIGRRGTPRTLDLALAPGAESRISYALADARSFAGKRVLVVGLGDAAMEAAIAIARQPETAVTVSYRGATFGRGKARNIAEVKDLVAKGRLKLLFDTVPVAVGASTVTLVNVGGTGQRQLRIDAVLVLVGGVPSWDLLTRAGVRRS